MPIQSPDRQSSRAHPKFGEILQVGWVVPKRSNSSSRLTICGAASSDNMWSIFVSDTLPTDEIQYPLIDCITHSLLIAFNNLKAVT